MSKICENDILKVKGEFVSTLIDMICNDQDRVEDILQLLGKVSLNPNFTKLFSLFLQALSIEDFRSAHVLKQEVIQFIDVVDNTFAVSVL